MLKYAFLLAFALLLATPATAQLGFAAMTHDFGSMVEGTQARHVFVVENEGTVPLTLRSVRPSCGCTTPSYTTDPIAPGATGEITVVYDSNGRPGPFRRSIQVTADAGGTTMNETLYITGDVERETIVEGTPQGNVLFDRDAFDLGTVAAGQQVSHVFKMQHTGSRPIRITEVKSYPEGLRVVVPNAPVFADDLVDIRVTLPAGAAEGPFDYAVVLSTDDEAQPAKSLRLTGVMR